MLGGPQHDFGSTALDPDSTSTSLGFWTKWYANGRGPLWRYHPHRAIGRQRVPDDSLDRAGIRRESWPVDGATCV
jgi:hypothetical protein